VFVQYTRFILYQEVVASFPNLRMCHVLTTRKALNVGREGMTELSFKNFNFRFLPCIFKVSHSYWPTDALNCIKLKG